MGWDKDSLLDKANVTCKLSKTRDLFTTSHQQAGVHPCPGKEGSARSFLGRQTPSLQTSHPSFFFTPALIAKHDTTWCGTSPWPAWASCPGCVPSQLLVHPQTPPGRAEWGAVALALCKQCSATTTNINVLSLLFSSQNTKHNIVWDSRKKTNSVPAKSWQ